MKPSLTPPHGTSLGTTAGITAVITMVAAVAMFGQCNGLEGLARVLAACASVSFIIGAGGLYTGRNLIGEALDSAASQPPAASVAAARGLVWFHVGMSGVLAAGGFTAAFRLGLPYGGLAWAAPAAAALFVGVSLKHVWSWRQETIRRLGLARDGAGKAPERGADTPRAA